MSVIVYGVRLLPSDVDLHREERESVLLIRQRRTRLSEPTLAGR